MDCPVCKEAMITLELDEVEVDYCLSCSGIWLDAGELEMLLVDSNEAQTVLNSFKPDKNCDEKPRRCPICLKKMEKILVGPDKICKLIDKCRKGHGLWFDKGELQDVIKMGSFDKERKIQKLLTDIFGSNSGGAENNKDDGNC
jgi:Zn-finger nucleic acid-binding protein